MELSQYLIKIIVNKFPAGSKLKYEETLSVINALSKVSEEKKLIEKIVELADILHNIQHNKEILTKREFQVFELIGKGFTSSEIAPILNISKETVSTHRKNIIKKLKLKRGVKLQNAAFQHVEKS